MRTRSVMTYFINGFRYLMGAIMLISLSLLFLNIILREFTSTSFSWVENTTIYLIMWIVFIGTGLVFWDDEHITMDFLYEKVSAGMKKVFHILIFLSVMATAILLLYFGILITNQLFTLKMMSSDGHIPLYLVMISIPLGSIICIISILKPLISRAQKDVKQ